jgi:hypothetical protein
MKRAALWAPVFVFLLAAVALAAAVEERYRQLVGTAAASRTAFSSDDSLLGDAASVDQFDTGGDPTIVVAPRFSAAGATATVEVWLFRGTVASNTCIGIADVQTATASTSRRESASGDYFVNEPLYFDSAGADVAEVRYRAVSSGTVEPWHWTCGAASKMGE